MTGPDAHSRRMRAAQRPAAGTMLLAGSDSITLWEETSLPGQSEVTMWKRLWDERSVHCRGVCGRPTLFLVFL